MAQIKKSTFRVLNINKNDIVLQDLEIGIPVTIESKSKDYDNNLKNIINDLQSGYKIEAKIESVDINGIQDGLWYFRKIDIINKTRIVFINNPSKIPKIFEKMKVKSDKGFHDLYVKNISKNGRKVGFISIGSSKRKDIDSAWLDLKSGTRSHEKNINQLKNITNEDPPYGIVLIKFNNYIANLYVSDKSLDLYNKMKSI